ncbi:AGC/PKA protein kinase [Puccinia triticina 1-1 BBBD Race 1]|uniref:cAMP-dependent protein kinase n=1 Tax=Puccinia triticina (isolate 1-1 / race 1 (BBBD)) TaxID=630390 RepID=A0A0C4ENJ6_PUCT1|nr:AGC/PKA protein kinase [Puccinia triticina 1-1 BBBD Race 1]
MSAFDPLTVNQADLSFNHPPPPKYAPPAAADLPTLVSPIVQPPLPLPPATHLAHPSTATTPPAAAHQLHPNQQLLHHHHQQHQHSQLLQQQQLQQYQQHQHQQHELLKQQQQQLQQQQLQQQQQQIKQQQHELLLQQQQHQTNPHFPTSSPIPVSSALESNPSTESQASDPTKNARKTSSRYALADFDLIRTLGTGSFGRVHLSKSRHNGRGYAIKVLNKKRVVGLKQVEHTNSERQMLAAVRHPFLVNLWGTFADSYNLYMVMDFVSGGELFNLLRKSQRFPDPVAKFFGAEVALALDYLHCLDIVYRDLKPENILLGSDGHIKITDFGFAKLVPDITWTLCGTPDYLAPEIVQSKGYNKSVDWYALGVLIFEMLAGYPPFYCEEESPMRLYEKIIAGKVRYPSYFNPSAKDLLKSLLTSDLSKRFGNLANGSRDIFHHAWFAEVDWERLYRKQIPAPYVPRVSSEWDASNFDHYDEASLEEYGKVGEDPYGHLFPGF